MRQDGKLVRIANNGSNDRSVSMDAENQSCSVESWLREGRLDATRAMMDKGFFGAAVADSSDGESDDIDLHAERIVAESPAQIRRVVHWYKPGSCAEYSSQRSNSDQSANVVGRSATEATGGIGGEGRFDCGERRIGGKGCSDCGEWCGASAFGTESGATGKVVDVGGGTRLPLNQRKSSQWDSEREHSQRDSQRNCNHDSGSLVRPGPNLYAVDSDLHVRCEPVSASKLAGTIQCYKHGGLLGRCGVCAGRAIAEANVAAVQVIEARVAREALQLHGVGHTLVPELHEQ